MARMTDRLPYQAIIDRPRLRLPGDARVALWVIVNVEEWAIERPMPRTVISPPMGQPLVPDLPNWSWHEYGNRVGFWRILKCLADRRIRVTFALNGHVCESYPRIAGAARDEGWEFMGHGFVQRPMHHLEDQAKSIADTVDIIRRFTGAPPRGWESPGMSETEDTLDLLAGAGIEYVANWVVDDLPCELTTKHGPILSVPYTVETSDIVLHAVQLQPSDALKRRSVDQFDRLYLEGADNARIMAISLHPYISGVPHRMRYLEELFDYILGHDRVALMTGGEIADWYKAELAGR